MLLVYLLGQLSQGRRLAYVDMVVGSRLMRGIGHARFSVRAKGLDQKLTGVEAAAVVSGLLR